MSRLICIVALATFLAGGCGKKTEAPPPAPARESGSSVEKLMENQTPAPPPPPTAPPAEAPAASAPSQPSQPSAPAVESTLSTKVIPAERRDRMELLLHMYQKPDQAQRSKVMSELKSLGLTADDRAFLERTRVHFNYPPLPQF